MKIAVIVNEDTAMRCTGAGCLKAFMKRIDAFADYPDDVELIGFTHSGGDLERKIERFKKNGVDTIHLSSCMRSKYEDYEKLGQELSKDFNVIGYTHGGPEGKTRPTVRHRKGQTISE